MVSRFYASPLVAIAISPGQVVSAIADAFLRVHKGHRIERAMPVMRPWWRVA